MMMAFVLALVMNFVSYWFSDKIVLKMYGAQPIGEAEAPEVHRIVRNLATQGRHPHAEALPDPLRGAECLRHRAESRSTPRWR